MHIALPAACFLYVAQVLSVGVFLFNTFTVTKPKESQVGSSFDYIIAVVLVMVVVVVVVVATAICGGKQT